MKSISKTNTLEEKDKGLTLSGYYDSIPAFPKKDFINEICKRCEVNENTVRNWMFGRSKPQKESHYRILSELTGIAVEELFAE